MKKSILLLAAPLLFVLMLFIGCGEGAGYQSGYAGLPVAVGYGTPVPPPEFVTVRALDGTLENVQWQEYIAIVVASELPVGIHCRQAKNDPAMLARIAGYIQPKAVAAQSYGLGWMRDYGSSRGYDLLAGPSCQNYDPAEYWNPLSDEVKDFVRKQVDAVAGWILIDPKAGKTKNEPALAHYGTKTHSGKWTLSSPSGRKGMYAPAPFLLPVDAQSIVGDLENKCEACKGLNQWLLMEHALSRYVSTKTYRIQMGAPVPDSPTELRSVEEYLSWFYPNYALYRPGQAAVDLGELLRRELPPMAEDGGKVYRLGDLVVGLGVSGVAINQRHETYRKDSAPAYNASFSSAKYDGGGPEVGFRVLVQQSGAYRLAVSSQTTGIKVSALLYEGPGQPIFTLADASGVASGEVALTAGEYFVVLETSSPSASAPRQGAEMPPVRFSIEPSPEGAVASK